MKLLIRHLDYSKFYALFSAPFSGEKPGFLKPIVSRVSEYEHLLSWQRTVLIKKIPNFYLHRLDHQFGMFTAINSSCD